MSRTLFAAGRIPARNATRTPETLAMSNQNSPAIVVACCQCGQPQPLKWEPLDRATVWCNECLGLSGSPYASKS